MSSAGINPISALKFLAGSKGEKPEDAEDKFSALLGAGVQNNDPDVGAGFSNKANAVPQTESLLSSSLYDGKNEQKPSAKPAIPDDVDGQEKYDPQQSKDVGHDNKSRESKPDGRQPSIDESNKTNHSEEHVKPEVAAKDVLESSSPTKPTSEKIADGALQAANSNSANQTPASSGAEILSSTPQIVSLVNTFNVQLNVLVASGNFSTLPNLVGNFTVQLRALLPASASGQFTNVLSSIASQVQSLLQTQILAQLQAGQTQQINPSLVEVAGGTPDTRQYEEASLLPLLKNVNALVKKLAQSSRQVADQPVADNRASLAPVMDSLESFLLAAEKANTRATANATTATQIQPTDSQSKAAVLLADAQSYGSAGANNLQANPVIAGGVQVNANGMANNVATAVATAAVAAQATASNTGGETSQGGAGKEGQAQSNPLSSLNATGSESTGKTGQASFSKLLNPAKYTPVVDQVSFQIKSAVKTGKSEIHIQLDPASLGKLSIKLSVASDGRTMAVVTADNKDTLTMLQKDASGLERALSDAGLKTDSGSLSFNLRGEQQGQDKEGFHASNEYSKSLSEDEEILPTNIISRSYLVDMAEGLDIKI